MFKFMTLLNSYETIFYHPKNAKNARIIKEGLKTFTGLDHFLSLSYYVLIF